MSSEAVPVPNDAESVRRALRMLNEIRAGEAPKYGGLPKYSPVQVDRAMDIVSAAAKGAGMGFEELLASGWDPDPRVGRGEFLSWEEAVADLDEGERYAAVRCAHSLKARSLEALATDPTLVRTLWALAHDRAIVETSTLRARAPRP